MKHAPTRTCLGCRQRRPKRELVRLVRRADGVVVVGARATGRGAYVCAASDCVERALKSGRLAHAFRAACRPDEGLALTVLAAGALGAMSGPLEDGARDRAASRLCPDAANVWGSGGHFGAPRGRRA